MKLGELRTVATAMPILVAAAVMLTSVGAKFACTEFRVSQATESATPPPTPLLADDKVLKA